MKLREPNIILKELIDGNCSYRKKCAASFECLKEGQRPEVGLLTCGDSRVPASLFGIDTLNKIFVVKNIGNQVRNSEGSVKYPIIHLKTPIFIVLGHTGCGAIYAANSDYREEDDAIQHELVSLRNSIRKACQGLGGKKITDRVLENSIMSEVNVDHQIAKMMADYSIRPLVESGSLAILGMMFDIHSIYGTGCAHVFITNINGETRVEEIRKHKVLAGLSSAELGEYIKRLQ